MGFVIHVLYSVDEFSERLVILLQFKCLIWLLSRSVLVYFPQVTLTIFGLCCTFSHPAVFPELPPAIPRKDYGEFAHSV